MVRCVSVRCGEAWSGLDTWRLVLRAGSIPAAMYGPLGLMVRLLTVWSCTVALGQARSGTVGCGFDDAGKLASFHLLDRLRVAYTGRDHAQRHPVLATFTRLTNDRGGNGSKRQQCD